MANLAQNTLTQVGSAETLLADAARFAAAAGTADAEVALEIWPHMIHAWNAHLEAVDARWPAPADLSAPIYDAIK